MEESLSRVRRRIVRDELKQLEEKGYITEDIYINVVNAHNQFYINIEEQETLLKKEQNVKQDTKKNSSSKVEKPPAKIKSPRSPQEVRERNITWSLNLGVILLLIGGLVLATSTWDLLGNWMKTGLIAMVSLLFFSLAYFTKKVLKISKTAFAFHVLGSLFLPIIILSAGYFELLGSFFSFDGEGRYLYGAAGSIAILPVYLSLAFRLGSRLFIWFSYVTISSFVSFLIASLYLPIDGFYLGVMMFNALLILAYRYLRLKNKFKLFLKEFVSYIQANLILSTLLMIVFYNNELVHSGNLLLTAALYFAMIFVTNQKEYHFVFSAMLVYGAYQLIEFSILNEVGPLIYALLGIIFVLVPMMLPKDIPLHNAFRYTSAVVSFCAFLYITFEGILLKMGDPSLVLALAYILISLNFTYLATVVKMRVFNYLSPVFFMVGLYEFVLLIQELYDYQHLNLAMFVAGYLFYIIFGCIIKLSFFQEVRNRTRDVSTVVMVICILVGYIEQSWWQAGTMLLVVSMLTIVVDRFEKRIVFAKNSIASWIHAVSLGMAVTTYYAAIVADPIFYRFTSSTDAENLVLAGIIVLLVSFVWRQLKRDVFYTNTFLVAQIFYAYGILQTFSDGFDATLRWIIVLGGVGMAFLLYKKTQWTTVSYVVSGFSLLFYLTLIYAVNVQLQIQPYLFQYVQFTIGAVLLLVSGSIIGNRDTKLATSFWWIGHLYLPFALAVSILFYVEDAFYAFAVAVICYGISVHQAENEWKVKTFLYACFSTLWIAISLSMVIMNLEEQIHYSFLITSVIIVFLWYISKGLWVKRIAYYAVPFSIVGITSLSNVYPYELDTFVLTICYAFVVLFIIHKEKWDLLNVVPLILIYYALLAYSQSDELTTVLLAFFGGIVTVIGSVFYSTIYQGKKNKLGTIDWYSIIGLMAFINLYGLTGETLWSKLLPGILIVNYLIIQRKRIPFLAIKWVLFVAGIYLMQPYYAAISHFQIPELIEMELYVLPWIIPAVLLKKITVSQHKTMVSRVQWVILLIISLLLVQDGMASNTIYDALIVGVLSLASILAGMAYQMKSFFFVGSGVLLLNVFLQTRPYWGEMPWWVYLLIAGSILITVASYNEWHKQKTSEGKETLISIINKRIVKKIKKWD
ncbi:SCO7613 C-terminal domain-containing membrane protein [Virgibacillus sp. DJP39]|uniref:SCO7613 C-terminal domain-containing membrane protein n=1 Tax=Virgibacillus sp. DJP39 TaxID=3409790 RepID=UPI003BB5DDF7